MDLCKNCYLKDKLIFVFCQLALNFCLLCPDSQLGKTLIDGREIQSVSAHVFLETWWL